MLKPLEQFICDVCGEVITLPAKGVVVWAQVEDKTDGRSLDVNFRIVHKNLKGHGSGCDDNQGLHTELTNVVGLDGMVYLTSFLNNGPFIDREGTDKPDVGNMGQFVDLFRRLQLPKYEEARQYFGVDEVQEEMSGRNELQPFSQAGLEAIIEIGSTARAGT